MADFYFYNDGTGDTDWNNPNNWWLDSGYTSTVGAVPTPLPGQLVEIDTQLDANIPNWTFGVVIGNTTVTLTVDNVCSGSITVFFPGVLNIQGSTLTDRCPPVPSQSSRRPSAGRMPAAPAPRPRATRRV